VVSFYATGTFDSNPNLAVSLVHGTLPEVQFISKPSPDNVAGTQLGTDCPGALPARPITFQDGAPAFSTGTPPYDATFSARTSLNSRFAVLDAKGDWKLRFTFSGPDITLLCWELDLTF
jgi:hypothetical protein